MLVRADGKDFGEIAPDVGEAGDELGSGVGFCVPFVGSVAVALNVSAICFADGFDELICSAANAPVIEEAAAGDVGAPKVSLVCFATTGHEVAHGGFVKLEVI